MRYAKVIVLLGMLLAVDANAAIRYAEARIVGVETSDDQIHMFFEVISGDSPPSGNGGTNGVALPYLLLATKTHNQNDLVNRRHMLASALTALSTGVTVRIRWDDANQIPDRVDYLLIRN